MWEFDEFDIWWGRCYIDLPTNYDILPLKPLIATFYRHPDDSDTDTDEETSYNIEDDVCENEKSHYTTSPPQPLKFIYRGKQKGFTHFQSNKI